MLDFLRKLFGMRPKQTDMRSPLSGKYYPDEVWYTCENGDHFTLQDADDAHMITVTPYFLIPICCPRCETKCFWEGINNV